MTKTMNALLALTAIALFGCAPQESDTPPNWVEKGHASHDDGRAVWRDASGCYWLRDGGSIYDPMRALMVGVTAPVQWCDAPPAKPAP